MKRSDLSAFLGDGPCRGKLEAFVSFDGIGRREEKRFKLLFFSPFRLFDESGKPLNVASGGDTSSKMPGRRRFKLQNDEILWYS